MATQKRTRRVRTARKEVEQNPDHVQEVPEVVPDEEPEAQQSEPAKPVYQHVNRIRCNATSKSYPAFLGRKCGTIMRATGTNSGGKVKSWKCPTCGHTRATHGKEI